MFKVETMVSVPFEFCEDCSLLEIRQETLYTDARPFATIMTCEHAGICEHTVDLLRHSERRKQKDGEK